MCTLMQKDVLIENLAETSAFIGRGTEIFSVN